MPVTSIRIKNHCFGETEAKIKAELFLCLLQIAKKLRLIPLCDASNRINS